MSVFSHAEGRDHEQVLFAQDNRAGTPAALGSREGSVWSPWIQAPHETTVPGRRRGNDDPVSPGPPTHQRAIPGRATFNSLRTPRGRHPGLGMRPDSGLLGRHLFGKH